MTVPDPDDLSALGGRAVVALSATTVPGNDGPEPATVVHYDDGCSWTFVYPLGGVDG
jgi:hypothetical protein